MKKNGLIEEHAILAESQGVRIRRMVLYAPEIATKAKAGQFIVLMVSEYGERIPLTIVSRDATKGTVTLIFQEAGLTTTFLGRLVAGDFLYALAGPLGTPTEMACYGEVIIIGGGVGIAEAYPVAKAYKDIGNRVTAIVGARTKDFLILLDELKAVADEIHVTTDNGSFGRKGFVTDVLKELITKHKYNVVYAVGPLPMMKAVSNATKAANIKTLVSLNALMVDATGMCGSCRVSVDGKTKFSCIDGPEFPGHLVDWDELDKRNKIYASQEAHVCKLKLAQGSLT
ncbi:MAG: sulfide/dihydroorotate dehydrogenase-like FAD/NAD-binding protein [Candidatus Omnitrophota bacterium]|jgi:ferredoxin--NADP+ reductase|nr:MAG: sulfide/dihydroorotate dehydrogenase-like FAD/NAD-binding protein [Candidatus Omnitrophota bacterium]